VSVGNTNTNTFNALAGQGLDNPIVSTAVLFQKVFAVDGKVSKVIDPASLTVSNWVATAGTLPPETRFAGTYRGRIVLARDPSGAANWFMSRQGNAFDWDFGANPESTAAVAGNSSGKWGQPSDGITALIPYSDDLMIFGAASSIWMLEGDPGAGGRIQNVSYKTGIIGPRAWCYTDTGELYFLGSGGLYRMPRGTRDPQLVSGRRLTRLLDRVNTNTTFVQLAFDSFKQWIMIFLTPTDDVTPGVHVIYDTVTDAFWPMRFANPAQQPWSVLEVNGVEDEQRRVIYGGSDGFVRKLSDTVTHDDGLTIASLVRFPAIELVGGAIDSVVAEMQAEFSPQLPASIQWFLQSGRSAVELDRVTAQDLFSSISPSINGTFDTALGFQVPVRTRRRGASHQLILSHDSGQQTWAAERIRLFLAPAGRRR